MTGSRSRCSSNPSPLLGGKRPEARSASGRWGESFAFICPHRRSAPDGAARRFPPQAGEGLKSAIADLDAGARRRVRLAGVVAALAAIALVLLSGGRLSRPLFDLFQTASPAPASSGRVAVVVIDADSLHAIGGWPWSRFYLARLVEEIGGRGASAIGLDLLMPEPDR